MWELLKGALYIAVIFLPYVLVWAVTIATVRRVWRRSKRMALIAAALAAPTIGPAANGLMLPFIWQGISILLDASSLDFWVKQHHGTPLSFPADPMHIAAYVGAWIVLPAILMTLAMYVLMRYQGKTS